jgi:hypothetical protein
MSSRLRLDMLSGQAIDACISLPEFSHQEIPSRNRKQSNFIFR